MGEFEGICISRLEIQMFFWPSVYFYNPFCLQGCFPRRPFVREFSLRTIYINFIVLCDDYLWDLCLHLSLQVSIVFIHSMMKAKKRMLVWFCHIQTLLSWLDISYLINMTTTTTISPSMGLFSTAITNSFAHSFTTAVINYVSHS